VVGVIGNYLDGLGPVWGTMLGLSVFGLTIMGVAAVLGYRDPLSPWQLAKRIRKVSLRANRFAEEWSGDQGSAEGWMWSYNARIAPQIGTVIEDMKDAGYVIPPDLRNAASTGPAPNYLTVHDRARALGVLAERLGARRVESSDT
jgi:hypothetical protein